MWINNLERVVIRFQICIFDVLNTALQMWKMLRMQL